MEIAQAAQLPDSEGCMARPLYHVRIPGGTRQPQRARRQCRDHERYKNVILWISVEDVRVL